MVTVTGTTISGMSHDVPKKMAMMITATMTMVPNDADGHDDHAGHAPWRV